MNTDEMNNILADDEAESVIRLNDNDILGVLPLKNKVLFTQILLPITVARPKSVKLVQEALQSEKIIAVVTQKKRDNSDPDANDLHPIGVAAKIVRIIPLADGTQFVILQGIERISIDELTNSEPYLQARVSVRKEIDYDADNSEMMAIISSIKKTTIRLMDKMDNVNKEAYMGIKSLSFPNMVVNYVAANFPMELEERQSLLEESDLKERAIQLLKILNKAESNISVQQEIKKKTDEEVQKNQREYYLQQQMHAIQKELGDTTDHDVSELKERASKKHWPEEIAKTFENELKKLERMGMHSPEYSGQLNYLDMLLSLPWNEYSEDNLDIKNAQNVLEKDHYGIDEVKERILEFLAVLSRGAKKTPILCLYGPPGVGKTSLGKSIATALGRKYVRISLGGLHDESEIRGHRRTYIGAMPGRIIEGIKKAQSSNPIFMLDEIDKVSSDYKGDPTAALLEVLDPEQNSTFHDNYLDVPYDLSKVLFIATANSLQSIPRPLLDRMELIEMTGYLQEEKEEICKRHLIPKELDAHGLQPDELVFSEDAVRTLINDYTRESGVRELDRQLQSVIRKAIKQKALGEPVPNSLQPDDIHAFLGKPKYSRDRYENNDYNGVVTGLAWTQVGGEILFIETSLSTSKTPTLTLTGNLGDVMKESATLALGYIRAHASDYGIQQKMLETKSIHLHVPEGAIPKDGPSAGITMTTAMISAFTGRKVRERVAMTGEMTLRGKVLPVGGIKEKILAAKRAGIKDIVLCYENEKDVLDIKPEYLQGITFHYVHDIHEVIDFALI